MKTLVRISSVYMDFQKTKLKISVNFHIRKNHFHVKTFNFLGTLNSIFLGSAPRNLINILTFLKVLFLFLQIQLPMGF